MIIVSSQLKAARRLLGLSQDFFAKECGLSQRTMVAVENGKSTKAALMSVLGYYTSLGVVFTSDPVNKIYGISIKIPHDLDTDRGDYPHLTLIDELAEAVSIHKRFRDHLEEDIENVA